MLKTALKYAIYYVTNRNDRLLDLIFVNHDGLDVQMSDPLVMSEQHHEAISVILRMIIMKFPTLGVLTFTRLTFNC